MIKDEKEIMEKTRKENKVLSSNKELSYQEQYYKMLLDDKITLKNKNEDFARRMQNIENIRKKEENRAAKLKANDSLSIPIDIWSCGAVTCLFAIAMMTGYFIGGAS